MKAYAVAILLSFNLVADAQVRNPDVVAPVNVATQLYLGCLDPELKANTSIDATVAGVNEYVQSLDRKCINWTAIWFKPLMDQTLSSLPADAQERFDNNRKAILGSIRATLLAAVARRK